MNTLKTPFETTPAPGGEFAFAELQSTNDPSFINECSIKLERAGYATIIRASNEIHALYLYFTDVMKNEKDNAWREEVSTILDSLKHAALDGLEMLGAMNIEEQDTISDRTSQVGQAFLSSKNELHKFLSPAAAYLGMEESVKKFLNECLSTRRDLDTITGFNRDQKSRSFYADSSPKNQP
jgi:hypothetical protein